jgi:hypothetical protein
VNVYDALPRFRRLFSGLDEAFGTGEGRWVKRPPRPEDFIDHLNGVGPGIGIGPLRPDNTVLFAAIDLDEPDFEAAREMQQYIPGPSFIERSRSGNAHVWVFFAEPLEAWVAMGLLKLATEAVGKDHVEVFPKNWDFQRVTFGNYINLPYHGNERPILFWRDTVQRFEPYDLDGFLLDAAMHRNDPEVWRKKARFMQLVDPATRKDGGEFGTAPNLHVCARRIIEDGLPIHEGNRNGVFFMLAKCLSNWSQVDHEEALELMLSVNDESPDPLPRSEIIRILGNAERGRYTSTGCDDALCLPYADPSCPIAFPSR